MSVPPLSSSSANQPVPPSPKEQLTNGIVDMQHTITSEPTATGQISGDLDIIQQILVTNKGAMPSSQYNELNNQIGAIKSELQKYTNDPTAFYKTGLNNLLDTLQTEVTSLK